MQQAYRMSSLDWGANANAAAVNANLAAGAYPMGSFHEALPGGCITPSVSGGGTYYLCGNTWFSPAYGANGVYLHGGASSVAGRRWF